MLRPGLLAGVSLLVVGSAWSPGAPPSDEPSGDPPVESYGRADPYGQAVCEACEGLGARVRSYARDPAGGATAIDTAVADFADSAGLDMLVVDGAALFALGGLRECLDGAWDATRAVVNRAFLADESGARIPRTSTRRIVYLAPAHDADYRSQTVPQADAARAGLENLARTLSVEWARYEITLVTIAPGETTAASEVAALCAYLASPAGAYFSGTQLDLRGLPETRAV